MEPIIKPKSHTRAGANVAIPLTPGASNRIEIDDATKDKFKDRWKQRDSKDWDAIDIANARDAMLEEEAAKEENAREKEAREQEQAVKAVEEQSMRDRDKGKRAEEASDMETEEEGHRKNKSISEAAKKQMEVLAQARVEVDHQKQLSIRNKRKVLKQMTSTVKQVK